MGGYTNINIYIYTLFLSLFEFSKVGYDAGRAHLTNGFHRSANLDWTNQISQAAFGLGSDAAMNFAAPNVPSVPVLEHSQQANFTIFREFESKVGTRPAAAFT